MTQELVEALNTMNVTYKVSNKGKRFDFKSIHGGEITVFPTTMTTICNGDYTKVDREDMKKRLVEVIDEHVSTVYYHGIERK